MIRLGATLFALSLAVSAPVCAREPDEAARLVREAFAAYHRGKDLESGWADTFDRGIALAEEAIRLDPRSADARYVLFLLVGRRAERSGIGAQAASVGRLKELLDRTIELDPGHAHAWEAKGEMLLRLPWILGGSEKKGVEALRRAAELDPDWPKPHLRLAEHYRDEDEPERARAEAEVARDLARAAGDPEALEDAESLLADLAPHRAGDS